MNKPDLLNDTDKYSLSIDDFENMFDRYVFSCLYNLYIDGAQKIHAIDLINNLNENPAAKSLMDTQNGSSFLQDCESVAEPINFPVYYNKMKKINLIRDLQRIGFDTTGIYPEDPFDQEYTQKIENFDKMKIVDIVNTYKIKMDNIEKKHTCNSNVVECRAADIVDNIFKELQSIPDVGLPLQGEIFNTVIRGARKGILCIKSAGTGVGKSRDMVGNACELAYPIRYDTIAKRWMSTGRCEKVVYFMTEQDEKDIIKMTLAYLTGYNEETFNLSNFSPKQLERIHVAIDIMKKYPDNLYFIHVPDPSGSIVKNIFRRYNLQYGVEYFFYDYIFSCPGLLEEYRDLKLPEHVCLRLFTATLKNLALELNSYIATATQTNGEDDPKGGFKDFHNVQGSKAIAQLCDLGCVMSRPAPEELRIVKDFKNKYGIQPNLVTDIYKNRGGRWTMIRIWTYADLGCCRKYDLFVTTANMKPVPEFNIIDFVSEETTEYTELEKLFNNGEVTDEIEQKFYLPEEEVGTLFEDLEEAFGDTEEEKKRYENVPLSSLV